MAGVRSLSGLVWGRRCHALRRACAPALAALSALHCAPSPSLADPQSPGREIWTGADVSSNVWLVYSGVTFAPWSGIHDEGWRFRAAGGYGEYGYDRTRSDGQGVDVFRAETYYADFLVGYLKRFGELTAKAFVGASTVSHDISPDDEGTIAIGEEFGIKGVIELWLNIGDSAWGQVDLSWASAHDTRAARGRLGYRVWPKLSVGVEAGLNLDAQGQCRVENRRDGGCAYASERSAEADLLDYARAGAFVRYEWDRSEASLSMGVLGDSFASNGDVELAPYVTVNWLTQF